MWFNMCTVYYIFIDGKEKVENPFVYGKSRKISFSVKNALSDR